MYTTNAPIAIDPTTNVIPRTPWGTYATFVLPYKYPVRRGSIYSSPIQYYK
jgi:hypothetical protein